MSDNRIAIVGLSCRLPGAGSSLDSLWSFITGAADSTGPVPPDRWSSAWYGGAHPQPGKTITHSGSFLPDVAGFDAGYFQLGEEEAAATDPQHRLLLELSIEALEDAGLAERDVRARPVGVFVGLSDFSYAILTTRDAESINPHTYGVKHYMGANRISTFLDLRGPSFVTDAACATSLISLHLACQSLRAGECEAAICGAANVLILPQFSVVFSQLGTVAPDGRCKPFDSAADGYGRAEGAAVLVLKRLSDALAANDRIYGVIRGTGSSHGGCNPLGPWVPRHEQQAVLIERVMKEACVRPEDISYVETHGTGTQVGDREEALALSEAIGKHRKVPLPIGGIKQAVGHSEAAAGIAGVLKALGILRHRLLPGLKVANLRTDIDWPRMGLRVIEQSEPFAADGTPHLVSVNSFGVGGSYAHAIIEAPPAAHVPALPAVRTGEELPVLVPLSAKSSEALQARIEQMGEYLHSHPDVDFRNLTYTLCERRTHHDYRRFAVAASTTEFGEALAQLNTRAVELAGAHEIVFVFSGTGGQWWKMGRELLDGEAVFRNTLEAFDAEWQRLAGWSILQEMSVPEAASRIGKSTRHSTAAQVALQIALADLWRSWGILPARVMGHSLGELPAAYCAGALSLADLVKLTKARCDWQDSVEGLGTMASVALSEQDIRVQLEEHTPNVDVAAINAPNSTTISGTASDIKWICQVLGSRGLFTRQLRVTVPFHSRIIRAQHALLAKLCPQVQPRTPAIPFVSAALGGACSVPLDAAYFLSNFEQPVRFFDAMKHVLQGDRTPHFVEIGPHPVLGPSVEECLLSERPAGKFLMLPTLKRNEPERRGMLGSLGRLFQAGCTPKWEALEAGSRRLIEIPPYPWQHLQHWVESEASVLDRLRTPRHSLLGELRREPGSGKRVGEARILARMLPFLESHRIAGELIFPGAGFMEMMRAAAATVLESPALTLSEVMLERALVLKRDSGSKLRTVVDEFEGSIAIFASSDQGQTWTRHAQGRFCAARSAAEEPAPLSRGALTAVAAEEYYRDQWTRGYQFGSHFRTLDSIGRGEGHAMARLVLDPTCDAVAASVCALDAALQVSRIGGPTRYRDHTELPVGVARIDFDHWEHLGDAHLEGFQGSMAFDSITASAAVRGPDGRLRAYLHDIARKVLPNASGASWDGKQWLYREELAASPLARHVPSQLQGLRVAVLCEHLGSAQPLMDHLADSRLAVKHLASLAALRTWLDAPHAGATTVVDLRSFEANGQQSERTARAADAFVAIELVRDLCGYGSAVRLLLAARRDQGVERGPQFSALVGLARVAELEQPELAIRVVELDDGAAARQLAEEIQGDSAEREVLWTNGERHCIRVRRLGGSPAPIEAGASAGPARVAFDASGALFLRQLHPRPLLPGHVRIDMRHASLNFRDVMKVLGVYPAEPGDLNALTIGDEGVGVITEVGSGVSHLAPGDTVIVRTSGSCLATELCTRQEYVFKKPAGITDAEAATLPIVFSTAWYGLRCLAQLQAGERILIHSAAGGVGLAALQIAKERGAEIYCTAGSERKRAFIKSLGVEHVFSSKDLSFVEAIRTATHGEGIDVVLNSLVGAPMVQSLSLLREFGRFLEIGKRDLYANTNIGLYALRKNITYHAVDLAQLWSSRVVAARRVFEEVLAAIDAGSLRPLPTQVFPLANISGAFEHFRTGQHIGKIVVQMSSPQSTGGLEIRRASAPCYGDLVRPDACYLVTGGFGGVGRPVLAWLAAAGARHIVVVARAGAAGPEARTLLAQLEAGGVQVDVRHGSVTDVAFLDRLLAELRASKVQLRGIFHLAGVLRDALLPAVTPADVAAVFDAKLSGAWNLHARTHADELDFFTVFSSAVATAGAIGQSVYAMANASLDGLMRLRRAQGLPAQALGWGLIAGPGMATRGVVDLREQSGVASIAAQELNALLGELIPTNETHLMIRPVNWAKALRGVTPLRFESLRPNVAATSKDQPLGARIRSSAPEEAAQLLEDYLLDTAASILVVARERLSPHEPLGDFGLNSLTSINLLNRISYELGVTLGAFELGRDLTIASLAENILRRLGASLEARPQSPAQKPEARATTSTGAEGAAPSQAKPVRQPGHVQAELPVMPLQKPFLALMKGRASARMKGILLKAYHVEGACETAMVERTWQILAERHEALRSRFELRGGAWSQSIHPRLEPRVQRVTARSDLDVDAALTTLSETPWDITTEGMLRCLIMDDERDGACSVIFGFNHLAYDRVSTWILEREVPLIFGAIQRGTDPILPEVDTPYSSWALTALERTDPALVDSMMNAMRAVIARGRRPVGTTKAHYRILRTPQGRDPNDDRLLREVMAAAATHTRAEAVLVMQNARPGHANLSCTVGPLAMMSYKPTDRAQRLSENASFEEVIASVTAVNSWTAAELDVLYSRSILINYGAMSATASADPSLQLWSPKRWTALSSIRSRMKAMNPPVAKSPPATLTGPSSRFNVFNEKGRLMLVCETNDETLSDAKLDAIVRDLDWVPA